MLWMFVHMFRFDGFFIVRVIGKFEMHRKSNKRAA